MTKPAEFYFKLAEAYAKRENDINRSVAYLNLMREIKYRHVRLLTAASVGKPPMLEIISDLRVMFLSLIESSRAKTIMTLTVTGIMAQEGWTRTVPVKHVNSYPYATLWMYAYVGEKQMALRPKERKVKRQDDVKHIKDGWLQTQYGSEYRTVHVNSMSDKHLRAYSRKAYENLKRWHDLFGAYVHLIVVDESRNFADCKTAMMQITRNLAIITVIKEEMDRRRADKIPVDDTCESNIVSA